LKSTFINEQQLGACGKGIGKGIRIASCSNQGHFSFYESVATLWLMDFAFSAYKCFCLSKRNMGTHLRSFD